MNPQGVPVLQPQYQGGGGGGNQNVDGLVPKKESRFKAGEYKDLWALALWVICLLGFLGVSVFALPFLSKQPTNSSNPNTPNNNAPVVIPVKVVGIVVAISAVMGGVISLGYFTLMQK
jgi:multisubunit Na+/H+ antiporter MnhB subunit